ncbi:MAG TPA: 23S rRNA (pseudouridine(1915)-N(3))-methyltransferase RlmH [Salinivirgaceae bacterium]|nr:23S rRNA (pseudouridine(1915)-N(3))-methyltransferase RlmH [Salinivirgaceae bacterium]
MKIEVLQFGKTDELWMEEGICQYQQRIQRMNPLTVITLPESKYKGKDLRSLKIDEGKSLLKRLNANDFVVLLDEKGKTFTSNEFAEWIQQKQISQKKIVFVIGGAYGFSDEVYQKADFMLSLSPMTFSHQLVRVLFMEQLYRAFAIIHKIPYHHD